MEPMESLVHTGEAKRQEVPKGGKPNLSQSLST